MPRVAIIGANGQVGAEVCLILSKHRDIELVPICRNRLGSAFLRSRGIACRHGLAADHKQASLLLGDCDVIVNLALASGSLREASDANRNLINNSIEFSTRSAKILYFSTVSVYGTPEPRALVRWKNAYARGKLRGEALARKAGRRARKVVYTLRLGHVCGDLQNITHLIREDVAGGTVRLPDPDRKSNVVYTATIAESILKAATGELGPPGVYDVLNRPQWTWREVYDHEARVCGVSVAIENLSAGESSHHRSAAPELLRHLMGLATSNAVVREYLMQMLQWLSPRFNQRVQSLYYVNRAALEIASLRKPPNGGDAAKWREVGWSFLSCLSRTAELLSNEQFQCGSNAMRIDWAADLPPYEGH
jgi:nucleoside-diphosphate-sugar epimerase